MVDLDELEAKARAAKGAVVERRDVEWDGRVLTAYVFPAAFEPVAPDTILNLIERVRAGEELRRFVEHREHCPLLYWDHDDRGCTCGLADARERLESLAHSPQEA